MVVDNIEHDCHPALMRRVDHSFERFGSSIARIHGKWIDPVITPVTAARKFSHRH
jgi:hypothetical protein